MAEQAGYNWVKFHVAVIAVGELPVENVSMIGKTISHCRIIEKISPEGGTVCQQCT
jgi:hypothetical protein